MAGHQRRSERKYNRAQLAGMKREIDSVELVRPAFYTGTGVAGARLRRESLTKAGPTSS